MTTDTLGNAINFISSGNFVTKLMIRGSMNELWGMIRALQYIVLLTLVNVTFPPEALLFFKGAIVFASLDIFEGEQTYE